MQPNRTKPILKAHPKLQHPHITYLQISINLLNTHTHTLNLYIHTGISQRKKQKENRSEITFPVKPSSRSIFFSIDISLGFTFSPAIIHTHIHTIIKNSQSLHTRSKPHTYKSINSQIKTNPSNKNPKDHQIQLKIKTL